MPQLVPGVPVSRMGTRDAAFLRLFAKRLMVPALSWGIDITAGKGAVSGAHAASMFESVVMAAFSLDLELDCLNLF